MQSNEFMSTASLAENISGSNFNAVELLITDAKTALTFLDLAATFRVPEDRSRRIAEARRAYETILSFLPRLEPNEAQEEVLSRELQIVKSRLIEAGEEI